MSSSTSVDDTHFFLVRWLKATYHWCMGWAEHRYGPYALCFLSMIESIFFPIPVDPILVAMGAARPKKALWYAGLTSAFSVLGAILGYLLGLWFWDLLKEPFFTYVFPEASFELVLTKFRDNAFWAVFLAGFTPIPFKVFTLASGVASLAWAPFLSGAILGRSARFFLLGGILFFFGPSIREKLEKNFERVTLVLGALVILGLVAYQFLK